MTLDENRDIVSAQDYYPYGEILRSYTTGADINSKYKFTEKERDTETNYDYFGARYYDSDLGKWLSVDPMSSFRPWLSPYNYCQNNPLLRIDPTGMLDTRLEFDENGQMQGIVDDGKTEITGAIVNDKNEITQAFTFNDALDAYALMNSFNNPDNYEAGKNTDKIYLTGIDVEFNTSDIISLVGNGISSVLSAGNVNYPFKLGVTFGESKRYGKMDYANQMKNYEKLKVINGVAYNFFDAGNYLWGLSMNVLGYSYSETKIGSHIHSIIKDGIWDSEADQKAIYNGFHNK